MGSRFGTLRFAAGAVGIALATGMSVGAQCLEIREQGSLLATGVGPQSGFGYALALDSDVALVGTTKNDPFAEGAYVFRRSGGTWVEEQGFSPTLPGACRFGQAVALHGDVAVVGDWGYEASGSCQGGPGAASVYRYDGASWNVEAELIGPASAARFGAGLALHDGMLIVGAPGTAPPNPRASKAFAFRFNGEGWDRIQSFTASDTTLDEGFGECVALSEDGLTLVVGAPLFDQSGLNKAGAAYVFQYDGSAWVEQQKLVPADPEALAYFGSSVAIAGDAIAVGAPYDDTLLADAGSVYVFRFDGTQWVQTQNFAANPQLETGLFGRSLAMKGQRLAVGELGGDRAHLYREVNGTYRAVQSLTTSPSAQGFGLGYGIALGDDRVLASAIFAYGGTGAVYEYPALDLGLSANPSTALGGQSVTFTTCGGLPGTTSVLALVGSGQGTPFGAPLLGILPRLFAVFVEGRSSVTIELPTRLAGRTLRFQAFGDIGTGARARSNVVRLRID